MSEASAEFAGLLARARRGDAAALAELVRRYEPDIRIAARVRLGKPLRPYLDSMDVVQSVHHSLLAALGKDKYQFASLDELIAFAVTLVRRKIAKHWREHQREVRLAGGLDGPCDVEQVLFVQSNTEEDPARVAQFRDQVRHLCRGFDATERRLVELRLQGYKTAEAAREMGANEGVLRVRLQRLRKRLHEHGVLPECV